MIQTIDLTGRTHTTAELLAAVPRATAATAEAGEAAARIIAEVRAGGEAALRAQAAAFDRVEGHALRVPQSHIDEALAALEPGVRAALEAVIVRVREASAAQVPAPAVTEFGPGARVIQRW